MKINYDKEGDVLYIKLNSKKIYKTREVGDDFLIDVDKKGNIVGIEVLEYSSQKPQKDLFKVSAGDRKIVIPTSR